MKILFGTKFFGQDTIEVPSGFLVWIIEEYDKADWTLVQACKKELAARLKIDWSEIRVEISEVKKISKRLKQAEDKIELLEKILLMSIFNKGNRIAIDGYLCNPSLLNQHINFIKELQTQSD